MILYKFDCRSRFTHEFIELMCVDTPDSVPPTYSFSEVRRDNILKMSLPNFGVEAIGMEIIWGDPDCLVQLKNIDKMYGSL